MIGLASPYDLPRRAQLCCVEISPKPATVRKMKGSDVKDDVQKMTNATFDATNHSVDRVTKSTQAIVSELVDYSKRSFENGTKTLENLLGGEVAG